MICNYVSKIIPALQSRCTRFKFKHIALEDAQQRIFQICDSEGLRYTKEGILAAFKLCEGDMRRVVNMLQVTEFAAPISEACSAVQRDRSAREAQLPRQQIVFLLECPRAHVALSEILPLLLNKPPVIAFIRA